MTTERQIAANRRNALSSTGPRTEPGRGMAAGNALKHGLTARRVVVLEERPEDFEQFHAGIAAALAPADALEEQLVERIAVCQWRLRRIYGIETSIIHEDKNIPYSSDTRTEGATYLRLFGMSDALMSVSRYEAAIERSLHRALHELEGRRARHRDAATLDLVPMDGSEGA